MIQRITVTTLDLPELQPYRTLRRHADHINAGIFVAEGEKVVRRLMESGLPLISFLMTREWSDALFPEHRIHSGEIAGNEPIPVYIAEKRLVESIVGYNLHQGIMAVGKVPAPVSPAEMVCTLRQPFLLVALDRLVNAENVGLIVRNCAAFGVDGVLVGESSSSPYLRRAVRNSMGTVFSLPVAATENLAASLLRLHQEYSTRIVAAHPRGNSTIYSCRFSGNVCIVLGNEGEGISERILHVANDLVGIPMMKSIDSLNVASASAVFLFEARRQREAGK
ncbi:MAG TPA: RNA methyltransferase [Bacteroidota bacterium]|nr:RNA methyltransferase [Bacteroidota bacterium]